MRRLRKRSTTSTASPPSIGALVGAGCNLAWQLSNICASTDKPRGFLDARSRVNYWEVAGYAGIGGVIFACLPDMIEPATSPFHRGFFHSVGCGSMVTYGAFGDHSEEGQPEERMQVRSMALCYLSHLVLDSGTPMRLPVL